MVLIHQLTPRYKLKKKKRVGRGGKRGTYSGRGIKGQKARAGAKIKPQEKEILLKLPKLRGYKFNPIKEKPEIITFATLEKNFQAKETVSLRTLKEKKIISKNVKSVKILYKGKLTKPLIISGIKLSKKAKEEILKLGGKVI